MKTLRGFTLIETLIYIGLFAVIMSLTVVMLYQIIANQDRNRGAIEVEEEANFVMGKIKWGFSAMRVINQPTTSSTGNILSLDKWNFSQNPLVFGLSSGTVTLARGTSSAVALTSDRVFVDELTFYNRPSTNNYPPSIVITMGIRSALSSSTIASTTLRNAIYSRSF